MNPLSAAQVNGYLAHKQHLLAGSRSGDVVEAVRDICALHATLVAVPYLSIWARVQGCSRDLLDNALYTKRTLARLLCMRQTLHIVPSDELPFFFQAYSERYVPEMQRMCEGLLIQGGLCAPDGATRMLESLEQSVLTVVGRGAATVQEISRDVPSLRIKVIYSVGRPYLGELSIGSRLVPGMCAHGLLTRARPRGTWQSNLYEYAVLADWLPTVDLQSTTPPDARAWLVRCYLSAFGPASVADIQWWTGFTKGETLQALHAHNAGVVDVAVEWSNAAHLMLADDARRLRAFAAPALPNAFLLPALDPYIMGYHERRRFLAAQHNDKVFDRAGNAMATVWLNARVAGVWGQKADGTVIWRLFEPAGADEQALLADEAARLESFLAGEVIVPRFRTVFYREISADV